LGWHTLLTTTLSPFGWGNVGIISWVYRVLLSAPERGKAENQYDQQFSETIRKQHRASPAAKKKNIKVRIWSPPRGAVMAKAK
jgi:hypothetical protein